MIKNMIIPSSVSSKNLIIGLIALAVSLMIFMLCPNIFLKILCGGIFGTYAIYRIYNAVCCVLDIQEQNMRFLAKQVALLGDIKKKLDNLEK